MKEEIEKETEKFRMNVVVNSIKKCWEERKVGADKNKLITEMCKAWRINKEEANYLLQKMKDMQTIEEEYGEYFIK